MIITTDTGAKYKLDAQAEEYFLNIYADCLVKEDGLTVREHHVKELIDAAKRCNHKIDEETAEEILEGYQDDLEQLKTGVDYLQAIKEFFGEDFYDPSMVKWQGGAA